MGRSRLGGCPKLHCGIHQLSKPPAEDAGVRALEERRLLHCLDLDKVLNELSTLGGDALAIRGRIEQHCCKPVLPTRKRKDQGDKLRTKLAYEYQAADKRSAGDSNRDLREAPHDQIVGAVAVEGRRNADDCGRITRQLERVRRKVALRPRGKAADGNPCSKRC